MELLGLTSLTALSAPVPFIWNSRMVKTWLYFRPTPLVASVLAGEVCVAGVATKKSSAPTCALLPAADWVCAVAKVIGTALEAPL